MILMLTAVLAFCWLTLLCVYLAPMQATGPPPPRRMNVGRYDILAQISPAARNQVDYLVFAQELGLALHPQNLHGQQNNDAYRAIVKQYVAGMDWALGDPRLEGKTFEACFADEPMHAVPHRRSGNTFLLPSLKRAIPHRAERLNHLREVYAADMGILPEVLITKQAFMDLPERHAHFGIDLFGDGRRQVDALLSQLAEGTLPTEQSRELLGLLQEIPLAVPAAKPREQNETQIAKIEAELRGEKPPRNWSTKRASPSPAHGRTDRQNSALRAR